mgnify:CR=1 FL=1
MATTDNQLSAKTPEETPRASEREAGCNSESTVRATNFECSTANERIVAADTLRYDSLLSEHQQSSQAVFAPRRTRRCRLQL